MSVSVAISCEGELQLTETDVLGLEVTVSFGARRFFQLAITEELTLKALLQGLLRLVNVSPRVLDLPTPFDKILEFKLKPQQVEGRVVSPVLRLTPSFQDKPSRAEVRIGFVPLETIKFLIVEVKLYGIRAAYGGGQLELAADIEIQGQRQIVALPFERPAPKPPAFELKYLALGQRLQIPGASEITSVAAAVDAIEAAMEIPETGFKDTRIGDWYNADSNWLFATHFLIAKTLEFRAIFNDPVLYGLDISLGEKAGALADLRFEILYKKITDDIGEYFLDFALPSKFRNIQLGAAQITLPTVQISIYTNGDFRVALGWPLGDNSLIIQAAGFIGGGGFYFAKLSGDIVPALSRYKSIVAFGLALTIGRGIRIVKGPLTAELSVSIYGVFEGVLAWVEAAKGDPDFFYFEATVGIIGVLEGAVDFKIIRASVTVRLTVSASLIFVPPPYQIAVTLHAGVSIAVSLKIAFIKIHFSFHATLTHTFVLQHGKPLDFRIQALARTMVAALAEAAEDIDRRTPAKLTGPDAAVMAVAGSAAAARPTIPLFFLPQVTVAFADDKAKPQFVASLMIRTRPPAGETGKPDYETLVDTLVTATVKDGLASASFADLQALVAADTPLQTLAGSLIQALSEQAETQRAAKAGARSRYGYLLSRFSAFSFRLQGLDQSPEEAAALATEDSPGYTLFPLFEEVVISWNNAVADPDIDDPAAGGEMRSPMTWSAGLKPPSYAAALADYFEALAAAFRQPEEEPLLAMMVAAAGPESTALIVFTDYWDLVIREALARIQETAAGKPDLETDFRVRFAAATAKESEENAKIAAAIGVINDAFQELLAGWHEAIAAKAAYFLQSGLRLPESFEGDTPGRIEALYQMSGLQLPLQLRPDTAFAMALAPDAGATWTDDANAKGVVVVPATAAGGAQGAASGRTPYRRDYLERMSAVRIDNSVHSFEILNGLTPRPKVFALREMTAWRQLAPDDTTKAEQRIVAVTAQMARLIAADAARFALFESPDDVRRFAKAPDAADGPLPLPLTPALKIPLSLRRVRSAGGAGGDGQRPVGTGDIVANTYEIGGTDETSRRLLNAVLTAGGADAIADIAILFNGDGDVLRSQPMDPANSLIIKTNLSTESQPPPMLAMAMHAGAPSLRDPQYASFTEHRQVLRLIWELSIVNSGGFFLYYKTAEAGDFPDDLFESGDQAAITLLVRFTSAARASTFLATPAYGEVTATETPLVPVPEYANALVTSGAPPSPAEGDDGGVEAERAAKQQHAAMLYAASDQVEWDATVPPGSVGFRIRRAQPLEPAAADDPGAAQAHVETLYSLMQFRISAGEDFRASPWSVPFGPGHRSTDPDEVAAMQSRAVDPAAIVNGDPWWTYEQAPAVFRFIADGASTPKTRYSAVGKRLGLDFRIGDMFGNWLADATPTAADGQPLMPEPRSLAYWDRLIGVDAIPGWSVSYTVSRVDNAPRLRLWFAHDALSVIPVAQATETLAETGAAVPPGRTAASPSQLEAARAAWARCRLILDQLNDGLHGSGAGTTLTLRTSLAPTGSHDLDKVPLIGAVEKTLDFVTDVLKQSSLPEPLPPPSEQALYSLAIDPSIADQTANLFAVEVSVGLSRSEHLGEGVDTKNPQAKSIVTPIPPKSGRAGSDAANAPDAYGLGRFAADFADAFGGAVRLALGRRKWGEQTGGVDAVARGMTLWALRLGAGGVTAVPALHAVPTAATPLADYFAPPPLCPKPRTDPTPPRLLDGTFAVVNYDKATAQDAPPGTIWSDAWQEEEAFTGIDLDVWGRAFLTAVEDLLTPSMAVALVRNEAGCAKYLAKLPPNPADTDPPADDDVFKALLKVKEDLADAVSDTIQPVLQPALSGALSDIDEARRVFRERLLVDLAAAYDVSAIVQVPVDVSVAHAWLDVPKYYGAITAAGATAGDSRDAPGVAFSVAKLSLKGDTAASPRPLTFLFTAANPTVQSLFVGDLSFDVDFIEHEIAETDAPAAFAGYLPSSWLKLIAPIAADGTRGGGSIRIPLGRLAVPVALREFPKAPVLRNQGTLIPKSTRHPADLRRLLDWTYELVFDQAAVAQDSIDLDVIYNERQDDTLAGGERLAMAAAGEPARPAPKDLFEALARFSAEYPQLRPIFERLTDSTAKAEDIDEACLAVVRAYVLVRDVAVAWLDRPRVQAMLGTARQDLARIVESFRILNNPKDVYKDITIEVVSADAALPTVSFPGLSANGEVPAGASHTYALPPALRGKAWRTLALHYLGRNVLTRQNAVSQLRVTRNAALGETTHGGDGRTTNRLFEYKTAMVRFPNVLTPLVDHTEEISVADGPGTGLRAATAALLKTLLGPGADGPHAAIEGERLIKLAISYVFDVIDAAGGPKGATIRAEVPILMTSDFRFSFPSDYDAGDANSFVSRLAATVGEWHGLNQPAPGNVLLFDLTVFANLSQSKLPLLRLHRLALPIAGVDEGWWTG